nr:MAG TPA: hypothetical protein [Caudoviricetes sp.]
MLIESKSQRQVLWHVASHALMQIYAIYLKLK